MACLLANTEERKEAIAKCICLKCGRCYTKGADMAGCQSCLCPTMDNKTCDNCSNSKK